MNTKFIKVSVEERLPENNDVKFLTDKGYAYFYTDNKKWYSAIDDNEVSVEFWLEEVPEREAEMIEILKSSLKQ